MTIGRPETLGLLCVGLLAAPLLGAGDDPPGPTLTNSLGMEMRLVPAGRFVMGSPPKEADRRGNEGPAREITISSDFRLGAHEVTIDQFRAFVEATGYRTEAERDVGGGFGIDFSTGEVRQGTTVTWRDPGFPDFQPGGDHPVLLVSWQDAEAFCRWLSEREGRTYRLPTEAEWEYAARGGTSTPWSTGRNPAALRRAANLADASLHRAVPAKSGTESWDDGHPFTAPVGSYEPNAFGLYDMHGNVWEWCADWYDEAAYLEGPATDPTGPPTGTFRAIRGGGWFNPASQNRSAQRVYFDATFRYCLLSGFRVLLELD